MNDNVTRKDFIRTTAIGLAAAPFVVNNLFASPAPANKNFSINIFSKNLQWLSYADMAALAAKLGFDGIDVTVRPGGHVLPERVKTDLPLCVEAIRKAGLNVNTITTAITSASEKYTDDILQTATQLDIKNYRMGWVKYLPEMVSEGSVAEIKKVFKAIAQKNKQYNIHGDYENHTDLFGASIWDLWAVIKDLDPRYIGCQFDINHATVDGGKAWPVNLELIKSHIGSITIKDFIWTKTAGKWQVQNVPLGEGMVDFDKYFSLLKQYDIKGPLVLHYEYPLGGADQGASKLSMPEAEVIKHMEKDIATLKTMLKKHQLI